MEMTYEFIDWMESALTESTVPMTNHQREIIKSTVAKSRFNVANQGSKIDLSDEEMSCFGAAITVYAMGSLEV